MERGPNDLEAIIQRQSSCIERQRLVIDELEKISSDKVTSQSTLFMDKESFNMEEAKSDILGSLDLILKRRKWILSELK